MKLNFSEPKIYTGGVDISSWSSLSKTVQKEVLLKTWYIYYSFRNPETGKLKRQTNIKGDANKFKSKKDRYNYLKVLQSNLLLLLQKGFNPYQDNSQLEQAILYPEKNLEVVHKSPQLYEKKQALKEVSWSIKEAFDLGLTTKKKVLNKGSYTRFKSRINRFKKWLLEQNIKDKDAVTLITKSTVIRYLNVVLQESSPRNRNNSRTDIGALFQTLEDNEVIQENFVKKINVLTARPKRNKSYTPSMEQDIFEYLKHQDKILLLFIQFISYNLLRPIEVCRLRVKDLDFENKRIYLKAKNKEVKTKIIPDILLQELPDLSKLDPSHYLFTPEQIGGVWKTSETDKRNYFTKRFKKVKDYFGLDKDYGMYSFRHTFITKLYQELIKSMTPFEAKSKLMLITGHTTMNALMQYLRDIDAELPEDYSDLLK